MNQPEGRVASLRVNIAHKAPMMNVESMEFVAGQGIEGDHHFNDQPHRQGCHVLLIEEETLDAVGIGHGVVRENVNIPGIDLNSLQSGDSLGLGDNVVLQISKAGAPCRWMDDIRPGLQEELQGCRGMLAAVVQGGTVSSGDTVRVLQGQFVG